MDTQLGPYGAQHERAATDVPIQVAAGVALDDGTRTDATVPLTSNTTHLAGAQYARFQFPLNQDNLG